MQTFVHLYLAQFCLELEMFQTGLVEKIEKTRLCSVIFLFKVVPL
jgi:hypothetical protein